MTGVQTCALPICQVLGPQGVDARQVSPHGGSVELLHLLLKLLGHPLLLLVLLGVCKLHHHGGGTALEEVERERERERERAVEKIDQTKVLGLQQRID